MSPSTINTLQGFFCDPILFTCVNIVLFWLIARTYKPLEWQLKTTEGWLATNVLLAFIPILLTIAKWQINVLEVSISYESIYHASLFSAFAVLTAIVVQMNDAKKIADIDLSTQSIINATVLIGAVIFMLDLLYSFHLDEIFDSGSFEMNLELVNLLSLGLILGTLIFSLYIYFRYSLEIESFLEKVEARKRNYHKNGN